ncbi:unnamed protein product [Cylicocyclus nassatus]|uniref:Protein quiver n=1 Tax=Cylicocyclus nassatus TaxID=53992 RepID=A0AA36HBF4_CYLNA|nr:unnamed protein product [Cylicocyclus nassatus]
MCSLVLNAFMRCVLYISTIALGFESTLECFKGIKNEDGKWLSASLLIESCPKGSICSIQIRTKSDNETSYILGCSDNHVYIGDFGCGKQRTENYKDGYTCVCDSDLCNLDLIVGRLMASGTGTHRERMVHVKPMLTSLEWKPTGEVDNC